MSDFISKMTDQEIEEACIGVVGLNCLSPVRGVLIGLIIEKLQEWNTSISFGRNAKSWRVYNGDLNPELDVVDSSLQTAFLRTARALGHWSPPKNVEERTLEERVARLEAFVESQNTTHKDLRIID